MIYNNNMTVENIIQKSVTDSKLASHQARRDWVRRMLNYYGGNGTNEYIKNYFSSSAFQEIPSYNANFTRRFINNLCSYCSN